MKRQIVTITNSVHIWEDIESEDRDRYASWPNGVWRKTKSISVMTTPTSNFPEISATEKEVSIETPEPHRYFDGGTSSEVTYLGDYAGENDFRPPPPRVRSTYPINSYFQSNDQQFSDSLTSSENQNWSDFEVFVANKGRSKNSTTFPTVQQALQGPEKMNGSKPLSSKSIN